MEDHPRSPMPLAGDVGAVLPSDCSVSNACGGSLAAGLLEFCTFANSSFSTCSRSGQLRSPTLMVLFSAGEDRGEDEEYIRSKVGLLRSISVRTCTPQ